MMRHHPIRTALILMLLWVVALGDAWGQCGAPSTVANTSTEWGAGLRTGQSFVATDSGEFLTVMLSVCDAADAQLVLRSAGSGSGENWNDGHVLGTSQWVEATSTNGNLCLTSTYGSLGYSEQTFAFGGVYVEAGQTYVLELVSGYAIGTSSAAYDGGSAFNASGELPLADLHFEVSVCPVSGLIFGCTDAGACNFSGANADDGSCLYSDCHGDCGGTAYTVEGCGCVGGNTGWSEEACYGCTDAAACNYDAAALVDDGSCATVDCHGVCGGSAEELDGCGCVGGDTGIPAELCIEGCLSDVTANVSEDLGAGLQLGQSFVAPASGRVTRLKLRVCAASEAQVAIRQAGTNTEDGWNDGALLGTSQAIAATSTNGNLCHTSISGSTGYGEQTFTFEDLFLEAGVNYVLELVSGYAVATASAGYAEGTAFRSNGAVSNADLHFEVVVCPESGLVFGCADATACNYSGANADDGSCLYTDCHGDCGGTAHEIAGCGCVEGNTGLAAESCYGCLDAAACNYDSEASIEDGSCATEDCHGECGGSAVEVEDCGCVGGSTGIQPDQCVDGCITDILETDSASCGGGLLGGQTFVATTGGHLTAVDLKVCTASNAQLAVRRLPGDCGAAWNSGPLLGTSQWIAAEGGSFNLCHTSISGEDAFQWRTFVLDGVGLIAGDTYVLELIEGYALKSCPSDYEGGQAYTFGNPSPGKDMIFRLFTCSEALTPGCTDAAACNYANTAGADDGTCQYNDCHGDCGGSAVEDADCGCIGGNTGMAASQCVNGAVLELEGLDTEVCSATLVGQTVAAPADGFLSRWSLHVDLTQAQSMTLTRADGPLAGEEVATFERTASAAACDGEGWVDFDLAEVPLQAGGVYRLDLTAGEAHALCSADYDGGEGIATWGVNTGADMAFRMVYRLPEVGELNWGCTDPDFCNYDATATHDDGTCAVIDCHGDCAGTAEFIDGCGCVGGNTGIEVASCYGCLDANACNYDSGASLDDGSCLYVDCSGECGGTAVETASCGCIGGSTGLPGGTCLERCLGTSIFDNTEDPTFQGYLQEGGGQTFTYEEDAASYLTALRFVMPDVATSLSLEVRLDDGSDPRSGTLLAEESNWTQDGDIVEFQIETILTLDPGTAYSVVLVGSDWRVWRSSGNALTSGASFSSSSQAYGHDLYVEILACDALQGCTSPVACNYEDWADIDNGSCAFAVAGTDCDGNSCSADADGDGICAASDLDDGDATTCFDGDGDGCDDCSSGVYDPANDGADSDGDGLCDAGDLCSDPAADNFDDPANGACRGECDNAPVFESIQVNVPASDVHSEDGTLVFASIAGDLPYVLDASFEATRLELTGQNGCADYSFDLGDDPLVVTPGYYLTQIFNEEGCPGVAGLANGSAFGQAVQVLPLIMTYSLCCTDCGNSDVDNDMICDSDDACTDRTATNFADPANAPCQY